ncbi:MAG: translation elongation factor P [Burkholderiales bacterium]|nr:translation elongation factor P [Burkholderiales bacterium]
MIPASELRAGTAFRHGGELLLATDAEYRVAAGKFGSLVFVKAKVLKTGHLKELRFHPDDKIEDVELERRPMEYLYADGDAFTFMDPESFEQVSLARAAIAPLDRFLQPGMRIPVEFDAGEPVRVVAPEAVELKVVAAPPGLKEHEGTPFKTVVLENGMEILAPQFIKEGDHVRVEVATGKYLERVRKDPRKP